MPLRSLRSSVLVWPTRAEVESGLRQWAAHQARLRPELARVGYFGSYARGDWGVGSDVDIILLLSTSETPVQRRALAWDATTLPVPADLVIYTVGEWNALLASGRKFGRTLVSEVVWVYSRGESAPAED